MADRQFPRAAFEKEGYHVTFRGDKQYNGVATASLVMPETVSFGLGDDGPADEDRLLVTVFPGLTVINTYVPQGRERETDYFSYKLEWFRRLRAFFERSFSPSDPLLWCGDLNVAREAIDVHDPKRLMGHVDFTPEVWEAFDYACSWGFVDLFRKEHPGEGGHYTFFDYRVRGAVERKLGWRVDHLLATPVLADRLIRSWIDLAPRLAERPSDHTVLAAEINREKGGRMDSVAELKRINEEIAEKFSHIEDAIARAADPVALFETWMNSMAEVFQIPYLWVSLIDIPENVVLIRRLRTSPLLKDRLNIIEQSNFRALTPNGSLPVLVNEELRLYFRLLPKNKYFVRSMAVVPLTLQGQVIGSLNHGDTSPARYDPRMDTKLLQSLAAKVSSCLAGMSAG